MGNWLFSHHHWENQGRARASLKTRLALCSLQPVSSLLPARGLLSPALASHVFFRLFSYFPHTCRVPIVVPPQFLSLTTPQTRGSFLVDGMYLPQKISSWCDTGLYLKDLKLVESYAARTQALGGRLTGSESQTLHYQLIPDPGKVSNFWLLFIWKMWTWEHSLWVFTSIKRRQIT